MHHDERRQTPDCKRWSSLLSAAKWVMRLHTASEVWYLWLPCDYECFRLGRRRSLVAYYAIAGIALILSQVIPKQAGEPSNGVPLTRFDKISVLITSSLGVQSIAICVCEWLSVCLSVRSYISKSTRSNFTNFSVDVNCGRLISRCSTVVLTLKIRRFSTNTPL